MTARRRSSRHSGTAAAIAAFSVPFTSAEARAQPSSKCDIPVFAQLDLSGTGIVSANPVRRDERTPTHRQVRASVNERGPGRQAAIVFEMRLPEEWNGRYFHQLNGVNDGSIAPAYGHLQGNPSRCPSD